MDSLQLLDLYWEGKMEPTSPSSQPLYVDELISEDYDFCNEGLFNNALIDVIVESKPIITSDLPTIITLPSFEKLEKDQWLDEKLKLPLLVANSYDSSAPVIGPFSHQQKPEKVQNTEELLMEFDYVYENVELTHLTPPQTPPQEAHFVGQSESQRELLLPVSVEQIQSQQQHETNEYYGYGAPMNGLLVNSAQTINQPQQQQGTEEYQIADSFGFQPVDEVENIARNLELVDEIVRSRSKDLPDCNDDDDSCSFSEDGSVSSSCPMSDSSSSYCGSAYSRDQDDEWSPSSGKKSLKVSGGGVTKKRTRPYGRGVEDKKSRKKEQNKNAATRYRQKKKAEIEEVLIEERKLRDKNEELKGKSADIGREIRYLKSLMREVFKVKGLI
ncbi:activating transcription factor of chaperone isoform X1 [Malaya genurostris]|uniref:activating transcription factor of chaperone isoform X1 n=1 Tax=Malaya genurostris TaxID=325434 RepID=UPI0026F3AA81|nr:activating transcription factor of chaperone isoform X1 [Malaya genurostris]